MAGHEVFNLEAEVNSFQEYRGKLAGENPDLSEEIIFKQALIGFNTMMFPKQVETYLAEKAGEAISRVEQRYEVVDGRLVDPFYGLFQKMIDFATSDEERETLIAFEQEAVRAKPGEIITVLDTSALGRGGGVKYLDTFEKEEDGSVRHKERINLTGEGQDLSFEEAKIKLELLKENQEIQPTGTVFAGLEGGLVKTPTRTDLVGVRPTGSEPEVLPIVLMVPKDQIAAKQLVEAEINQPVEVPTRTELVGSDREQEQEEQVIELNEPEITVTRTDFVGEIRAVSEKIEISELVTTPATLPVVRISEIRPAGTVPVVPVKPTRRVLAGGEGGLVREEVIEEKQTPAWTTVLVVPEALVVPVKPTRRVLAGLEREQEQEEQVIELNEPEITVTRTDLVGQLVSQAPMVESIESTAEPITSVVVYQAKPKGEKIPVYRVKWPKLQPLTGIPEWVWQPQAASIDEVVDWDLLLVMVFYALLSTKLILNIDREEEINDWPGERLKVKASN